MRFEQLVRYCYDLKISGDLSTSSEPSRVIGLSRRKGGQDFPKTESDLIMCGVTFGSNCEVGPHWLDFKPFWSIPIPDSGRPRRPRLLRRPGRRNRWARMAARLDDIAVRSTRLVPYNPGPANPNCRRRSPNLCLARPPVKIDLIRHQNNTYM